MEGNQLTKGYSTRLNRLVAVSLPLNAIPVIERCPILRRNLQDCICRIDKLRLFDLATSQWSDLASHSVGSIQWSADGKHVYFDTGSGAEQAVYRVRLSDRNVELIGNLQGFRRTVQAWVSWMGLSPDGSPLFMRDVGTQEVYALDFEAP